MTTMPSNIPALKEMYKNWWEIYLIQIFTTFYSIKLQGKLVQADKN